MSTEIEKNNHIFKGDSTVQAINKAKICSSVHIPAGTLRTDGSGKRATMYVSQVQIFKVHVAKKHKCAKEEEPKRWRDIIHRSGFCR